MNELKGKYAVITGGAKGIGRSTVERFLEEGIAGVAVLDYDIETARKTIAELTGNGIDLFAIKCDVGSETMVVSSFKTVYERFPRIDILVNNAGLTRDAMLHKMSFEQWQTVINADLTGIFFCMRQVAPRMREQNYGKIVNVSSTSAFGNVGQTNYAAAKAGILGLTATAAKELGRKSITVNAVLPDFIETDMVKTVPLETLELWRQQSPMLRGGKPEEVANVIVFLSSDRSSYVSGCSITVGGGRTITF
jgi:3-oxoacyl-[acyl-carrier protein] reductase